MDGGNRQPGTMGSLSEWAHIREVTSMTALINNVRREFNTDFDTDTLAFEIAGHGPSLEYLDEDGTLCAAHESNVHNYLPTEVANHVREQLRAWLADGANLERAVRWVSADEQGEYTGWTVPAGGDIEAVRAECLAELLGQCGTDEDREAILAGRIEVKRAA